MDSNELEANVFAGSIVAAFCYGVFGVTSTASLHAKPYSDTKPLADRSMDVFNRMADLAQLNDPARGKMWETSVREIAHDIRTDGIGWNWTVFNDGNGGAQLINVADRANIALVPHAVAGKPATLTVDGKHGCLQLDVTKSDEENKDLARALLKAFGESRAINAYGTYAAGKDGEVVFAPFGKNQRAADVCPAPG